MNEYAATLTAWLKFFCAPKLGASASIMKPITNTVDHRHHQRAGPAATRPHTSGMRYVAEEAQAVPMNTEPMNAAIAATAASGST